jgi:hypothetical protein
MMRNGNRIIKVKKIDLIAKIKENKKNHIVEYKQAVIAYKKEALKQLKDLTEKAKSGEMNLNLKLVTPVDNSENYDKVLSMFEWEVEDFVELDQQEFNEYVNDETSFAVHAKMLNSTYR